MADKIHQKEIKAVEQFTKRHPLALMYLGIDLGTYTYWQRAVFNMFASHLDMSKIGWPIKIQPMGHRLFEQMSLTQFYGWLKGHDNGIRITDINILLG